MKAMATFLGLISRSLIQAIWTTFLIVGLSSYVLLMFSGLNAITTRRSVEHGTRALTVLG